LYRKFLLKLKSDILSEYVLFEKKVLFLIILQYFGKENNFV